MIFCMSRLNTKVIVLEALVLNCSLVVQGFFIPGVKT